MIRAESVDGSSTELSSSKRPYALISELISSWILMSLFFVVIFDPSDSLTGLKKPIFLVLIFWWILLCTNSKRPREISLIATSVAIAFGALLPLLSVLSFFLQGSSSIEYQGFVVIQGYLSLSLLILINSIDVKALHLFVKATTVLAFVTVGLYLFLNLHLEFVEPVTLFGYAFGFLWINPKDYGGFQFTQIFFKTAPFLAIPVAYFSQKYFEWHSDNKSLTFILLGISSLAMFISGTRANMLFAVLIPTYFFIRSLNRSTQFTKIFAMLVLGTTFGVILANFDIIISMLDPNEFSNSVKLGYWDDYIKIFSDPITMLFGQGIGASHYFESLGVELLITEVTLLELLRNFGLFIALAYLGFWIAPLILISYKRPNQLRWLWVAYGAYLVISMSNYFLMSSTGMVFLSIVYNECLKRRSVSV